MGGKVSLQHVDFRYPKSSQLVFQNFSLEIEPGEFVILLGANGSGKSTLFRLLLGDVMPSKGKIKMSSEQSKIAYVAQKSKEQLYESMTVAENLVLSRIRFKTISEQEHYLDTFHKNLRFRLHSPACFLSGGEKQALILAVALFHQPEVLLMDEPSSAMDPSSQERLIALAASKIQEQRMTTLFCTHHLKFAHQYGTRIIGMRDGEIVLDIKKGEEELDLKKLECLYQ